MALGKQSLFDVDPSSSELGSAPGLWALKKVPGVGSTTALRLARACSSWEQLAANPEDALIQANASRVDPHVLATAAMNPGQPPTTSDEVRLVAILLDDQYTGGRSMRAAMDSLEGEGWNVVKAMTWSQSMQHDLYCPSRCFFRDHVGPSWNDCFCPDGPERVRISPC